MMKFSCHVLALCLLIVSCDSTPSSLSPDEFQKWIRQEKSGMVKTKTVNDVALVARFLPSSYLAYQEFSNSPGVSYDSIWQGYKCGLTFQVSLQAEKGKGVYGNMLQYEVASQEELSARLSYLNFRISEFIEAKYKDKNLQPVLAVFEGYDALGNKLNFQVVFEIEEYKCGEPTPDFGDIQLTFYDPIWNLGTNKFLFDKKTFTQHPSLKI